MKTLQRIWKEANQAVLRGIFFLRYRAAEQRGLAALEYIALAVLIVVAVAGAFRAFGGELSGEVNNLADRIFRP